MAQLELKLLGPLEINLGGEKSVHSLSKKGQALLCYLALPLGQSHSREKLAALLWGDRFDEQARQSLRQTLSALRKDLGDHEANILIAKDGGLLLNPNEVSIDIQEFLQFSESNESAKLYKAAAIYRGELCGGLVGVSDEFDAWLGHERIQFRQNIVDVLDRLVRALIDGDRFEEALKAAQKLVELDPVYEEGHRSLMRIYEKLGRHSAALHQFQLCKDVIARELDSEPSEDTVRLYEAIQASTLAPETSSLWATAPRTDSKRIHAAVFLRSMTVGGRKPLIFWATIFAFIMIPATIYFTNPSKFASTEPAALSCMGQSELKRTREPAIVILPLRYSGNASNLAGLTLGIAETIEEFLTMLPGLTVVEGPPADHDDLNKRIPVLAQELGVSHVLTGSVQLSGDDIRVIIRLIEGDTSKQIWGGDEEFVLSQENYYRIQDQLAFNVVRIIQEKLTDGYQARDYKRYLTSDIKVFEHNTTGLAYVQNLNQYDILSARKEYEAALSIQPYDPAALSGLALTYVLDVQFGWSQSPMESLQQAAKYANMSRSIDGNRPTPYSILGLIGLIEGDHEAAVENAKEAVSNGPSDADVTALLAFILTFTTDSDRSVALVERAIRLRPYSYPRWYKWLLARGLRLQGNPEKTIACLAKEPLEEAGIALPSIELALAYAEMGQPEKGEKILRDIMVAPDGQIAVQNYCVFPPRQNKRQTDRCLRALSELRFGQ